MRGTLRYNETGRHAGVVGASDRSVVAGGCLQLLEGRSSACQYVDVRGPTSTGTRRINQDQTKARPESRLETYLGQIILAS